MNVSRHVVGGSRSALGALAALFLTASLTSRVEAQETSIFNGRDLTGWSGLPQFWSVQDGAITGKLAAGVRTSDNTFIVWQGGEVTDFEIKCKYKLTPDNPEKKANSGLEFRAKYTDQAKFVLQGYQGIMDPGTMHPDAWPAATNFNGSLTDDPRGGLLAGPGQKVVAHLGLVKFMLGKFDVAGMLGTAETSAASYRKDGWNDYRILVVGNHIQIFVNGLQTVDAIDEASRYTSGLIGLKLKSSAAIPATVQFKEIVLRKIATPAPLAAIKPLVPTAGTPAAAAPGQAPSTPRPTAQNTTPPPAGGSAPSAPAGQPLPTSEGPAAPSAPAGHFDKTAALGGLAGNDFSETQPEGGTLVGLEIWKGSYYRELVIGGVRAIYQTDKGRVKGQIFGSGNPNPDATFTSERPGASISEIEVVDNKKQILGIRVHFSTGDQSAWVGLEPLKILPKDKRDMEIKRVGASHAKGIFGGAQNTLYRLGLIYQR